MVYFLLGVIAGLILSEFLPPDTVKNISQRLKIKKSTVQDSQLDLEFDEGTGNIKEADKIRVKKRGFFKRVFGKKNNR